MKIAVNTRLLIKGKLEGIGRFSYETLKIITREHPQHQFYFLFDRPFDEEFIFSDNITPLIIGPQARHPILWYVWFEFSIPSLLNRLKPDVFFSPDGYISLRSKIPAIPVIHDLNFEHRPQDLPVLVRKYYRHYFPEYAKKAKRIITVSDYSKNDISQSYGIDTSKIDVVYNAANNCFFPLEHDQIKQVREKYTSGDPYFLFVGAFHPRKNLDGLIQAFQLFKRSYANNLRLVIVGEKMWKNNSVKAVYDSVDCKDDIIFTGRLSTEELGKVTGASFGLVYVPHFEGFGIPIVEAMKSDVPVITSNVTSMPEVAGGAALLADPGSPESICENMHQLTVNENLRLDLIRKGRERSKLFSWERTAEKVWNSIQSAIS